MRCTCAYRVVAHGGPRDERGRLLRLDRTFGEWVDDPVCPEHGAAAIEVAEALANRRPRSRLPN